MIGVEELLQKENPTGADVGRLYLAYNLAPYQQPAVKEKLNAINEGQVSAMIESLSDSEQEIFRGYAALYEWFRSRRLWANSQVLMCRRNLDILLDFLDLSESLDKTLYLLSEDAGLQPEYYKAVKENFENIALPGLEAWAPHHMRMEHTLQAARAGADQAYFNLIAFNTVLQLISEKLELEEILAAAVDLRQIQGNIKKLDSKRDNLIASINNGSTPERRRERKEKVSLVNSLFYPLKALKMKISESKRAKVWNNLGGLKAFTVADEEPMHTMQELEAGDDVPWQY